MEPASDQNPPEEPPPSLTGRYKLIAATAQAIVAEMQERAQHERRRRRTVDVAFEMVDRDGDAGGGIIAGALAYRLFIWLLPLALVAVAGLGLAADASSESPRAAADSLGLAGLVSNSVASAANSTARWYALLIGVPILVYTTRSVLRTMIAAHRLLWGQVRALTPKPTIPATLRLLGLMLCLFVVSGVDGAVRRESIVLGLVITLLSMVPNAAIWLVISLGLPHREASWVELVPGALLVGVGSVGLHVFTAFFLAPYALSKGGTYGALGTAAGLLLGLYIISRLMVFSAVLNATLWERRVRPSAGA